jgi:cellulose biosynthesis protein BcsQ
LQGAKLKSAVLFNNKGGVGKTTLACNVVSYLNEHKNKRVLLIDADPQCNATQAILSEEKCEEIYLSSVSDQKTLLSCVEPLRMGESSIDTSISPFLGSGNRFCSDIIPGHPRMSIIEDRLSDAWNKLQGGDVSGVRVTNWCFQLLESISDRYDIVIFDVGPSLGALNRSILLACDYIITPFGCDIFSLLGIKNISEWIKEWNKKYLRGIDLFKTDNSPEVIEKFDVLESTDYKFRFAGYSVQQYSTRKFKEGARPVKAYDRIMQEIPGTVYEFLNFITPSLIEKEDLELGRIPYLYSLVPMAQSAKAPIHNLSSSDGLVGSQYAQVNSYAELMDQLCDKLLRNMGF